MLILVYGSVKLLLFYYTLVNHDVTDAGLEADVAKGRRDWAFSERDKVSCLQIINNILLVIQTRIEVDAVDSVD